MRTKEQIQEEIAGLLTDLRVKKGLSKTKIAEFLEIDKHTWMRWESGANMPSIDDLVMIYDKLGESMLRPLLDILYNSEAVIPDVESRNAESMRKDAAEYYLEEASPREVLIWQFASNKAQDIGTIMEAFCALGHLPNHYKHFLLQQLYVYYQMAKQHNELVHPEQVMPDMDIFASGLIRTQRSAFDRLKTGDKNAKL